MSQPHFEGSVRSPLTLPKLGLGSPSGLSNLQNSIARVKTPCIEVFFIPLERFWILDIQNGLAWAIWTFSAQVIVERRARSQIGNLIWLLTTKSRESTQSRCVQVECDILLESSQGELQVCFRPRPNRRSEREVMNAQSLRSPNRDNFETPFWESQEKVPFGYKCGGEV